MNKDAVAEVLLEIGVLLELKGENPFKTRAYANAARALDQLSEPLETTSRTLDSTLENLDLVEKVVLEFAQRAGFIGTALEKVGLAVRSGCQRHYSRESTR